MNQWSANRMKMGLLWIRKGDKLIPVRVKTGISDNSYTEIEGNIAEGDEVITGIVNTSTTQQSTQQQQSPFQPQMGRPPQGGGAGGRGGR